MCDYVCVTVSVSAILCNIHNITLPLTLNRLCRTRNTADSFDVAVNRHANLPLTENVSYVASRENHCSEVCVTEDNDDEAICKGNVYETDCVMDTRSFFEDLTLPPHVPERKYISGRVVSHH